METTLEKAGRTGKGIIRRLMVGLGLGLGLLLAAATSPTQAEPLRFNTEEFAPFNFMAEDGSVTGATPDLVRAVCADLELECAIELLPWRRALKNAQEGKIQGLFSLGRNPDRERWLFFSPPVVQTAYGFFLQKTDPLEYQDLKSLAGYTVSTYGPSNLSRTLEQLIVDIPQGAAMIEVGLNTALRKLSAGRYGDKASVYANKDVAQILVQDEGIDGVRYAGDERPLFYYIGFPKASMDRALAFKFNAKITEYTKSGRLAEILSKYGISAPGIMANQ